MFIRILEEAGYNSALLGLSLSYDQLTGNMPNVAEKLYNKNGGHNKFLESIAVWLDITAPRYWWQQFDTYRVGITKQSGSTMHTLINNKLSQTNFELPIDETTLIRLNTLIENKDFDHLKNELPEGFLQRRIICTNYKKLRDIILQRKKHKLLEWKFFCKTILVQIKHKEFFEDIKI